MAVNPYSARLARDRAEWPDTVCLAEGLIGSTKNGSLPQIRPGGSSRLFDLTAIFAAPAAI
jgi:hypothetical protein